MSSAAVSRFDAAACGQTQVCTGSTPRRQTRATWLSSWCQRADDGGLRRTSPSGRHGLVPTLPQQVEEQGLRQVVLVMTQSPGVHPSLLRLEMAHAFGYHASSPPRGFARGGVPEWPKGADCKSVGAAYGGSNPPPPPPRPTEASCRGGVSGRPVRRASIAQLAEHFHGKEGVFGSNPNGGSIAWRRSSVGQSSGIIIRVSEVRVLPPLPSVCGSMHERSMTREW